jgi:hypothetical protein
MAAGVTSTSFFEPAQFLVVSLVSVPHSLWSKLTMQFVANGPDIPDLFLQAHEAGRVVVFCGAGVSYPAGLPSFEGVAVATVDAGKGQTANRGGRG